MKGVALSLLAMGLSLVGIIIAYITFGYNHLAHRVA